MHHATIHPRESFLINIAAGDDRTTGHVATAQALCERDDIRLEIPMFEPEHLTGAPEAGLDFIGHEERPVLPAKLLRSIIEVALRIFAAFALDRLEEER